MSILGARPPPLSPPSSSKRPPRHGKQASIDLDQDFFDCIDRSDDSFVREFQEGLGRIQCTSGGDPTLIEGVEERVDGKGQLGKGTGSTPSTPSTPAAGAATADAGARGGLARVSEGTAELFGSGVSAAKAGEKSGLTGMSSGASDAGSEGGRPSPGQGSRVLNQQDSGIEVTPQQIAQVREQLEPLAEDQEEPDDGMIIRFIRATGGNLQQSIQRLNTTLKWRARVVPENVVCMACAAKPKSHYMHLCGYDYLGRPIIYSCLACATNKVYLDNYHHMIQTFEMAIKCMPPGVHQWVWVCDFHGFGMSDINPKLAKAFLEISAEHYPERLGLFVVAGAPSLFSVLWKAIASFVDPKTHQKIRFLPCDFAEKKSKMRKELELHFPESLVKWVETEMMQNRERGQASKKMYDLSAMFRQAQRKQLKPEGAHDLRGHESILDALNSNPSLMEPQATADQYLDQNA